MPLVTDNIEEARTAYSALEARAASSESLAQSLRAELERVTAQLPVGIVRPQDIHQVLLNRISDNERLRVQLQQAIVTRADISVEDLVASMGMAVAVGESTMPDRVVSSLSATVQSYITPTPDSIGVRFFQPGVDTHQAALSTTSFEIERVPPQPGAPAPRNLYTVLLDLQSLYSDPYWSRLASAGPPPVQPANDIVVKATTVLANSGNWNFPYLLQSAVDIANSEKTLAGLVGTASPSTAATTFGGAVNALLALTASLINKPVPVAGDLFSMTASLDNVTSAARALVT